MNLLKTYFKEREEVNNYIYELFSPLSINEFFTHPVLNVVLYSVVGKKEYERVTNYFKIPKLNISDYEDITKSFSDNFSLKFKYIILSVLPCWSPVIKILSNLLFSIFFSLKL